MKKRTLLAVLLVVPVGMAFAWHEEKSATPGMNRWLGTQSGSVTTGGTEAEARLGTQAVNIGYSGSESILGTQGVDSKQDESEWEVTPSGNIVTSKKWMDQQDKARREASQLDSSNK